MKINIKNYLTTRNLLIFLLILSAFLRFYKIDQYTGFGDDNARDLMIIKSHIQSGIPIYLGPKTSVGDFYVGPLYYYLITPIVWLFPNSPIAPALLIALGDTLVAGILFLWFVKFFNKWAGFMVGILYATSPITISFGSSAWNPNLIPLISTLFLYFSFEYYYQRKIRDYFILSVLVTMAIQLHFQGIILGLSLFALTLLTISKDILQRLIGAFSIFIFLYLPFLVYEIRFNYPNFKNIYHYYFVLNNHYYFDNVTIPKFFTDYIPTFLGWIQGENVSINKYLLFIFIFIIGWFGAKRIFNIFHIFNKKQLKQSVIKIFQDLGRLTAFELFTIIFVTFLVGLRLYKGHKHYYYLAFIYYLPAVIFGLIYYSAPKYFKYLLIVVFVYFLSMNIYHNRVFDKPSKDIQRMRYLTTQIEKTFPNQLVYMITDYRNFTNPVKYFLTLDNKLDENQNSNIRIKIYDRYCPVDYATLFAFENVVVGQKLLDLNLPSTDIQQK